MASITAFTLPGILVADQLDESPRDNLPGEAERILDPAARGRRRPGLDQFVPILVDLGLVLAVNVERDAFGERKVRATVVAHEDLTTNDELGGGDRTVLAGASDVPDFGVREGGGVELHGRLELIVEHQERCHLGHRRSSFVAGDGNRRSRIHPEARLRAVCRGFDLGRPEPLRGVFDPSPPPCEAFRSWKPWRNDPPARCPDKPRDLV